MSNPYLYYIYTNRSDRGDTIKKIEIDLWDEFQVPLGKDYRIIQESGKCILGYIYIYIHSKAKINYKNSLNHTK